MSMALVLGGLLEAILRWDTALFFAINRQTQNRFFDLIMPVLSDFHIWRWPLIAAAVAVVIFGGPRARATVVLALVAVVLSDQISSHLLKPLVARPRPSYVLQGVRLLVSRGGRYGFPSSHASNILAAWTVLATRYGKLSLFCGIIPLAVSYSRIYIGMHYPLDIFAGAVLGAAVALGLVAGSQSVFLRSLLAKIARRKRPAHREEKEVNR